MAGFDRGRAADGRLVDVDHLVEVLHPLDRAVAARERLGPVQLLGQRAQQDVVDQRRLARARDTGDRDEAAEREGHVDVLEVVLAGAADGDHVARAGAAAGRHRDGPLAREVLPGDGLLVGEQAAPAGHGAGVDDGAAVLPRPRADVDHVVGRADGLLVVLHHDDRVAQVAQPLQRADQPLVVALVQADGGLVEHVEHTHQPAADLAGQADALRLAAGQRAGRAGQREVVEPHVEQELHALADFLEDPVGDHVLAVAELERPHGLDGVGDGEAAQLVDVATAHGDGQRLGLEPRAVARGAVDLAHVLLDLLAGPVRLGLAVAALQPGDDALEDAPRRSACGRSGSCSVTWTGLVPVP